MRLQAKNYVAAIVLCLLLVGCADDNPWTALWDKSYKDDIQDLVEQKITERSQSQTGLQRWVQHKSDDYQTPKGVAQDKKRFELERKRREAAERLLKAGPLSLTDCLTHTLEFNHEVQATRAALRALGGEKLIAKSRFLPRLVFDLSRHSVAENVGRNAALGARAIQTLLEFGKDNPIDVALRELQRDILFAYEDVVSDVLSQIRLRFYTILLRQQQLAERRKLLGEFTTRYERMRTLKDAGRALEVDVLTAELNVLNEGLRINALEKEIVRQKMDLLETIGFPVEMTDFGLQGKHESFELPLAESVDIALRRSTQIAQARAIVYEQDRVVRQIFWEYLPSVNLQGGYRGDIGTFGAGLISEDSVYSASPFGEYHNRRWNGRTFDRGVNWQDIGGSHWYWGVELELPIFTGLERTGEFQRENALLERDRHLLSDTILETQLEVSKAYETVLEEARTTEILQKTVRISKERLRIHERLKELGKITDDELETFRERFFTDQDNYFEQQIELVEAQEDLRAAMRYFEPLTAKEN